MEPNTTIADQNTERLLQSAYQPEPVPPAFAATLEAKLQETAQTLAKQTLPASPTSRSRWAALILAGMAASGLILWAIVAAWQPGSNDKKLPVIAAPQPAPLEFDDPINFASINWTDDVRESMQPRRRPSAPTLTTLKQGQKLTTPAGKKHLVQLADGSRLYVNEKSDVEATADRQLTLHKGQIYLEVAPKDAADKFIVKAGSREFVATGTHFAVQADASAAGLVVTQGKVAVKGVDAEVRAGQAIEPGQAKVTTAPRASHALEWTRELMAAAESPMVPSCQHAGGALMAIDPNGQEIKLTMRKYHIDVHIEDGFARTTIDQTYFNETWERLEGTFYFPLPADASLSRLAMYVVDGDKCKLMEGGMAERKHAADVYETIRYQRRDPALLEWLDGTTFKMRVFPLEAKQEKRIVLCYTQKLASLYGTTRYRFPGGHTMPIVKDWTFTALVKSGASMDIRSPSHPDATLERNVGDRRVLLGAQNTAPKADVLIEMTDREAAVDQAVPRFASHHADNRQHLMLRYRPNLPSLPERKRRDWIVLFEASAQRDPLVAGTQVDIVRNILKNAEYDDTFSLLTINSKVNEFADKAHPARPANVAEAVKFLNQTHLVGALDLQQGLEAALKLARDAKNPHILHIGSGVPAMGERDAGKLARLIPENVPYVGVGVGKRWNRAFMKAAAERTNGLFTQINPDETIAWRAFDLVATLNTPRLLNVQVLDAAGKVPFLMETSMIAQGEELCAVARVDTAQTPVPGKVIVKGTLDGKPVTREFVVMNVLTSAGYLPRTWAKLEIDRLLAADALKHKNAIIELSKAMYVMSPFTSLLVLETDADYERFKVDKGRKDHWAPYLLDPVIAKVYEPGDKTPPKDDAKKPRKDQKPSVEEVLKTMAAGGRVHERMMVASELMKQGKLKEAREIVRRVRELDPENVAALAANRIIETRLNQNDFDEGIRRQEQTFLNMLDADPPSALNLNTPIEFDAFHIDVHGRPDFGFTPRGGEVFSLGRSGTPTGGPRGVDLPAGSKAGGKLPDGRLLLFGGLRIQNNTKPDGELIRGLKDAISKQQIVTALKRIPEAAFDQRLLEREFLKLDPTSSGRLHFAPVPLPGLVVGGGGSPAGKAKFKGFAYDWGKLPPGERGLSFNELTQGMSPEQRETMAMYFRNLGTSPEKINGRLGGLISGLTPKGTMTADDFVGEVIIMGNDVTKDRVIRRSLGLYPGQVLPVGTGAGTTFRYERPAFTYDRAHFTDLVQYAPGLFTTMADIVATLEAEAEVAPVKLGVIDADARKLIEQARSSGWTSLTIPAEGPLPSFKIHYNGAGQFAYEHVFISGLREQVICDGKTLWHLYPELGLASKRPFSRHHQHLIAALNPAFVPVADELARGYDVKALDAATIALIPMGLGELKKDEKYARVHLVFADGRLAERQIVEIPSNKVLMRQLFAADGTIEWQDADNKSFAKRTRTVAASAAPNLAPAVEELVVVNLPLRTREHINAEAGKLGIEENVDIKVLGERFVTDCMMGEPNRDQGLTPSRLFEHGKNRKLGYFVLMTAARGNILDQRYFTSGKDWYQIKLDEDQPTSALALFLMQAQRELHTNDQRILKKLPGPKDGFIQKLSTFRDLYLTWNSQRPLQNGGKDMPLEKAKVMEFLEETTSPMFAYAVLDVMQRRCNTAPSDHMLGLVEKRFGPVSDPLGLGYLFRYEHARSLYQAGIGGEASKRFRELHADALKYGVLPPIDPAFRDSLQMPIGDGPRFIGFTRKTLDELLGKKQYGLAFQLAKQIEQLGDDALSDEILTTILDKASKEDRNALTLVCVQFLSQRKNFLQADRLLAKVLEDKKLAEYPELWRWRAELTKQAGQTSVSIACLETALDLEYAELPEIVNLESIRTDYRTLLTHYQKIAEASSSLEKSATKLFLAKVIRTADRWRLIDPESSEPCMLAGKTLFTMGERNLAWDYWTTPIDLHPAESTPWLTLAETMKSEGDLEKADRAFALAFEAELSNPEILWKRAQNAGRMGQPDLARRLYRQIADGEWQERFQATVEQARGLAGQ